MFLCYSTFAYFVYNTRCSIEDFYGKLLRRIVPIGAHTNPSSEFWLSIWIKLFDKFVQTLDIKGEIRFG